MLVHSSWLLTSERAALHLPSKTAVLADLHLGYADDRCRAGDAVPVPGAGEVLTSLQVLVQRHRVSRLVIAGDLCENGRQQNCAHDLLKWICEIDVEIAVVPGNHDRCLDWITLSGSPALTRRLSVFPDGLEVGGWQVVHGHFGKPRGCILQGHLHPSLKWERGMSAPCYLIGNKRMILPAFSRDAAGINVLRDPSWSRYRCAVIVGERVLDFGSLGALRRIWRKERLELRG